jgi:peptidoglycan/LPS O-acetylase OafA/YrhL
MIVDRCTESVIAEPHSHSPVEQVNIQAANVSSPLAKSAGRKASVPRFGWELVDVRNTVASLHFDVIRAAAAIAVLVYHIRYRFFLDFPEVSAPSLLAKGYYFITAFGHDAVMVFFVLSGFLISGSIFRDRKLMRFSWIHYGVNRLTRLYVVLIPGLLLTAFWDGLGSYLFPAHPIYTGAPMPWFHHFIDVPAHLTPTIALGNVLFLQSIYVPELGSNGPLWSLSYEFWYYCLFPILYIGILHAESWRGRALGIVAALLVAAIVSRAILFYFPIWLMGTVLCLLPQKKNLFGRSAFRAALALAGLAFAVAVVAGHLSFVQNFYGHSTLVSDYVTAIGFSMLLYVLTHDNRPMQPSRYARLSQAAAGFSYTLYVVHMPFIVFLRAVLIPDRPWEPVPWYLAAGCVVTGVCLIYAYLVGRVTEAKTAEVRGFVMARAARLGVVARPRSIA